MRARTLGIPRLLALAVLGASAPAGADRNDLTLERLIGPPPSPGAFNDPTDLIRQSQYKSLMSELGMVMAPKFLSPADSLGYSGFQLSLDTSFTEISRDADYWQKGVQNVGDRFLPTVTVFARKGLWLPLPSMEIGVGGTKLIDSNLFALQFYFKLALHEGFQRSPLPSIAVRAAVARILGTSQVDLTVLSADLSLSKSFGLGGLFKLDPYLGANTLFTFVRGQVIDTTPNVDALRQGPGGLDLNANTTFPDPDTIVRWRLFAGFRLVYTYAALSFEVAYALCNDTGRDCGRTSPTAVTDRSHGQLQLSFSGVADFLSFQPVGAHATSDSLALVEPLLQLAQAL